MSVAAYDQNVFINCPFDRPYKRIFDAVVFTVFDCGFVARSALEINNAAEVRVEKIGRIIDECRLGLHDLSRTGLDRATRLPRFNMPFELGLFLGVARRVTGKVCLVLDKERYRYQAFISDIAGQDISTHGNEPKVAVRAVRNWLSPLQAAGSVPGPADIWKRYQSFRKELPAVCRDLHLRPSEMIFNDYATIASEWIAENARF
ncbi:MAG: hypothetical protein ACQGVK_11550 [Myxococcota bacterium]